MFTPSRGVRFIYLFISHLERRPIDSRYSGKKGVGNGLLRGQAFSWCQNVPKRPSRRPNTRSVEMACLQEWDADRRQAAHAEKSLAVRELVRLSLRVQSTGVVAELHSSRHGTKLGVSNVNFGSNSYSSVG